MSRGKVRHPKVTAAATAATASDDQVRVSTAGLLARLPTAVVCHAFSFLEVCDHAALRRVGRECARASLLPASWPRSLTVRLPVAHSNADTEAGARATRC